MARQVHLSHIHHQTQGKSRRRSFHIFRTATNDVTGSVRRVLSLEANSSRKITRSIPSAVRFHTAKSYQQPPTHTTESWPLSPFPTPYEVLGHDPTKAYSKQNFHQLVKIYHPDIRSSMLPNGLTHACMTERYRLILAAHSILNDTEKNRLYECHGFGWVYPMQKQSQDLGGAAANQHRAEKHEEDMFSNNLYHRYNTASRGGRSRADDHNLSSTVTLGVLPFLGLLGACVQLAGAHSQGIYLTRPNGQDDQQLQELQALSGSTSTRNLSREDRINQFLCRRAIIEP